MVLVGDEVGQVGASRLVNDNLVTVLDIFRLLSVRILTVNHPIGFNRVSGVYATNTYTHIYGSSLIMYDKMSLKRAVTYTFGKYDRNYTKPRDGKHKKR